MPTLKQRINITTNKETSFLLKKIAKRDGVPVATKAAQLLEDALEILEDRYFAAIAEERLGQKVKHIPHHLAWK
jgi:predicted DNA-binding protein